MENQKKPLLIRTPKKIPNKKMSSVFPFYGRQYMIKFLWFFMWLSKNFAQFSQNNQNL